MWSGEFFLGEYGSRIALLGFKREHVAHAMVSKNPQTKDTLDAAQSDAELAVVDKKERRRVQLGPETGKLVTRYISNL